MFFSYRIRLASFPTNETNAGSNTVASSKMKDNIFVKNKESMERGGIATIDKWIKQGQAATDNADTLVNSIKAGLDKEIRQKIGTQKGIDHLTVACCSYVTNKNADEVISKLVDIQGVTGVENPALNTAALGCGINAIMGEGSNIPRIGKVTKQNSQETYHLNWDNRDTWCWTEFAEALSINAQKNGTGVDPDMALFPKGCYLYCALLPLLKTSEYNGDWAAFPFFDEQIQAGNIYFTSKFGERWGKQHHGIDLATSTGTEIYAIADGTVVEPQMAPECNSLTIDHGNGIYSKYLHCDSHTVDVRATVTKGDVVATVRTAGTEDAHLHLEIGAEGFTGSNTNPIDYYPLLASCEPERGSHYYDLTIKTMY